MWRTSITMDREITGRAGWEHDGERCCSDEDDKLNPGAKRRLA